MTRKTEATIHSATSHSPLPQGYKRTELGVIPEDWNLVRIGEIGVTYGGISGKTKSDFGHGTSHYIPFMNVIYNTIIDTTDLEQVDIHPSENQNLVRKNDLFFNISSETPEEVGMCAVLLDDLNETYLNSFCFGFRPYDNDKINGLFLAYLFRSSVGRKLIFSLAQGATRYNLSKTYFLQALIPLPPLPEQRAIARALGDADAWIEALDRLIAKKRAIKQAAMEDLLTGRVRLPGFSGEWPTERMEELGKVFGGITGKTKSDFGHGQARYIPFMNVIYNTVIDINDLESVNIQPGEKQNEVQKGDLFFNGSSETPEEVGMCAVLLDELENTYLNSFCFGFRPYDHRKVNGLFLAYYFRSTAGRELLYSLVQGATRYNLSKSNFLRLVVPLPTLEEQQAIAQVLSDIDAEIEALERERDKARAIKQGMMQELLTGRIRLVKPQPMPTP